MARFKVIHSEDAVCIDIQGDKRNPEPTTAIIKFPGGHVEVSRCSDGSYWAHLTRNDGGSEEPAGEIVSSRIDLAREGAADGRNVVEIPAHRHILKMAVRIARS